MQGRVRHCFVTFERPFNFAASCCDSADGAGISLAGLLVVPNTHEVRLTGLVPAAEEARLVVPHVVLGFW